MTIAAGSVAAIVNAKATAAVCCGEPLSLTLTLKANVPLAAGVPEMTPVEEERVSPDGKLPEAMLQVRAGVPPVAATLWLYNVPKTPKGRTLVVIASTDGSVTYKGAMVTAMD
jgi:hypothetical protein